MQSDETSNVFRANDSRVSASTGRTSNPRCTETYSIFGDGSCGEPLFDQHVSLDFTPNDEIDNDFVQKKVCSFWKFIENTPEIHNWMTKPEKNQYTSASNANGESETTPSKAESNKVEHAHVAKTAVDMLEFIEEKGLIDRTFEAKLPQSKCTLGSREYKEGVIPLRKKEEKKKPICPCTGPCKLACPVPPKDRKHQAEYLTPKKAMSRKLKEWDTKHPKSMEPPGHAPSLQHCILQREVHP